MLVKEILTVVKFTNRKGTRRNKTKQTKEILPFCYYLQSGNKTKQTKEILPFCYYLQSGHIESQKDSHETLGHHSTAT